MYDGHFIDDPLHVVNVNLDFSGLGMEPIHINKVTMTETQKQQTRERIGKRIAALRKLAGMSQEDLALRAGLQRTHVSRIEAGKYAVTLETIQAIAEALYMTVDIIDTSLADLAPLKRLTPPTKGALGEALGSKATETFKAAE